MTNEPKLAIVGVGAVGGILGAHLVQAGHSVVLCDIRRSHLDMIRESGLSIVGIHETTARCEHVTYSVAELANFPAVDTIVVATKAYVVPQIVPELARTARPGTQFVSCQNGLDNEMFLAETLGTDQVLRIVVNYAGSQMGDGHIWMSFFNAPNYIGCLTDRGQSPARRLAEMLTGARLDTQFAADIQRHTWEKAILNSLLNPVCALTRKPMKDMMDLEITELLVEKLLQEGIEVARAAGITLSEGFFERGLQYLKRAGYHITSMHQDVIRQLPTEIDWINAKIVEQGRAHGIDTPYNLAIVALVKGLEMKSGAPAEHAHAPAFPGSNHD
jgi:2-dehydropantoate 2-reductase